MKKIFVPAKERPDISAMYCMDSPGILFVNVYGDKNGIVQIVQKNTKETQEKETVQG